MSQSLLRLATIGNVTAILSLLKNDASVNVNGDSECGFSPLFYAAYNGNFEAVKALVEVGHANVNKLTQNDETPLFAASRTGHPEIVQYLAEKGAAVNTTERVYGQSPLIVASAKGLEKVVAVLLQNHAEVNQRDTLGETALYCAASAGHCTVVKALLCAQADPTLQARSCTEKDVFSPLHVAVRQGHISVVTTLLEQGNVNVNAISDRGQTPLHLAAASGFMEAIKILIDKGQAAVDLKDFSGYSPLHIACIKGQYKVARALIESWQVNLDSCNSNGESILSEVCFQDNIGIIRLLVSYGADVNHGNPPPLHICAHFGYSTIVDYLLQQPAIDVNKPHSCIQGDCTPLFAACMAGYEDIVYSLVRKGHADTSIGFIGKTPKQIAEEQETYKIVRIIESVSVVAFLAGHHPRCGNYSILQSLPQFLLLDIAKQAFGIVGYY